MLLIFALCIGLVFACGVYLVLRRDLVAVAFGIGLAGTAINMLILVAGRVEPLAPPLINESIAEPGNPLPQAFVLTAIVIGFAVVTLLLALARAARPAADEEAGA